eukprot:621605-Amphidinium_carterae.1
MKDLAWFELAGLYRSLSRSPQQRFLMTWALAARGVLFWKGRRLLQASNTAQAAGVGLRL